MTQSFQNCIAEICGLELTALAGKGKYTVFGNGVAVVEGHRGIVEYSPSKVAFSLGKKQLTVCGEQLKIRCLEKHFAVVVGKIVGVAVQND